jgi:hypothetical protein
MKGTECFRQTRGTNYSHTDQPFFFFDFLFLRSFEASKGLNKRKKIPCVALEREGNIRGEKKSNATRSGTDEVPKVIIIRITSHNKNMALI